MMLKKLFCLSIFLLSLGVCAWSQTIFINEFNHLGTSRGLEIAGPANSNLAGWSLVIHDELGNVVNTIPINATIPNIQNNFGFIWIEVVANFQGPQGGAALVDDANQLVQFLSYGGEIKGQTTGVTYGIKSEVVGTQSSDADALQLTGAGSTYNSFTWNLPGGFTPGALNNGQAITNGSGGGTFLPVTWSYFIGTPQTNGVELKWATANEYNNDYFSVEHSTDGKNFQEIGQITGAGNSVEEKEYTYYHRGNAATKNYYRLVQIDFDGKLHSSEIIEVSKENELGGISIFPNPVKGELWVNVPEMSEETLSIEIFSSIGKRILIQPIFTNQETVLNLNSLPKGHYFVVIQGSEMLHFYKIIKE